LFPIAVDLINQANARHQIIDHWTFGGGTALMLHIDHRESHDVDLFITDPQLLGFLDPAKQGFVLSMEPSAYDGDGIGHLKLSFEDIGEVDFIVGQQQTEPGFRVQGILGVPTKLETPAEIIAKKIAYRGRRIQPRDIFDIAATLRVVGSEVLTKALHAHTEEAAVTLNALNRLQSNFVERVIGGLAIRDGFEDLVTTAYADAGSFLQKLS
jgi:hypothetical protein